MIKTRMRWMPGALALTLALTACGKQPAQQTPDQAADKLDQAAAQSDPTSAAVIQKRAEELRGMESAASAGEPGSYTQKTMEQAGAAGSQPTGSPAQ